ncbi:MAG: hypothetical protein KF819_22430 [Labilithrix sp.]|nr:hypothetical protein [Labilithrix sp.]
MRSIVVGFLVAAALPLVACHKPHKYETRVELTRLSVARKDDQGKPLATDVEFTYVECPGSQSEVVRGGKEFSECLAKHKIGDKLKVRLEHKRDPEGFFGYEVLEMEGCARPADPDDDASFKTVRDCADWTVNGAPVGFECSYGEKKELVKKCPWFATH